MEIIDYVSVQLDGRDYRLRLRINDLLELEERLVQKNIYDFITSILEGHSMSLRDAILLTYFALREDTKMQATDAADWYKKMTEDLGIVGAQSALLEAVSKCGIFGDPKRIQGGSRNPR